MSVTRGLNMNEREQYQIYEKLMMKALEEPNEVNFICMQVIISLAKIGGKDEKGFKEILDHMEKIFKELDDLEEMMMKAMVLKKVMDL